MDLVKSVASFWEREFNKIDTIIVGNGDVSSSEESLSLLKSNKQIISCDGALKNLISLRVKPDFVVGDGDSLDFADLKFANIPYIQDTSQDYNDLQKAFKFCLKKGFDNIALLGCGGLREDHFLANLSIMTMFSEKFNYVMMLTEYGIFNVFNRSAEYDSLEGMQISVFVKNEKLKLSFSGLKYPVLNRSFNWFWEGSLNESLGNSFQISSNGDEPILLFRSKMIKNR